MAQVKKAVSAAEEYQVSRKLLVWLNTYQEKPVDLIRFEFLPADTTAMAMSTIQAAYILQKYILGGYKAEYQFKLIYRIKPGNSNDKRLKADELLDALGDWTIGQRPDIGEGKTVVSVEPTTRSSLFAVYENGDEDHQILMKLTYEVNI
nr:MAG TPA: Minor capsid protein [Caudoviricetes sp.]